MAAVTWPHISSLAVDGFVGWLFLSSGVIGLVIMFMAPTAAAFFWSLVTGALALLAGVLLLRHPAAGVISLTLLLTAFFVAEGVFKIAASFGYRTVFTESWGWMLFSGLFDLILAGLIMAGWPGSAVRALGLFVGVNFSTSGVAVTMVAVTVRRVLTTAGKAFG